MIAWRVEVSQNNESRMRWVDIIICNWNECLRIYANNGNEVRCSGKMARNSIRDARMAKIMLVWSAMHKQEKAHARF